MYKKIIFFFHNIKSPKWPNLRSAQLSLLPVWARLAPAPSCHYQRLSAWAAQSCLLTAVIALDIFKAEYPPARQNIYLWKTFNSNPAYTEPFVMTPLPVVPVSPVWAGHDLGKCWAKFPASAPAGDTSLTLWTWEHSDEEEVQWGHRPHTNMGGVWWSRGKFPPWSQSHKVPGCQSQWSVPEVKRNKLN